EMPFLRRERPSAFTPERLDRRRAARRRYLQAARAPTQHLGCFLVREWYNPYPHGPASETTCSGLLCECRFRISLSISLWRVPIVPKERTAASCSSATEATEIVSLWPSRPTRRVLSCALADLRVYQNDSESIMWRWPRTGYSGLHLYEEAVLGFPLPLRERDRVRGKAVATNLRIQTKSAVRREFYEISNRQRR